MSPLHTSYIVTTKNKLPYLRHSMERLLREKESDEEILVADAASNDGTSAYLERLKREGKIDYFVSEPDYGESHALNKLLLLARGELIKIITDDDAFSYEALRNIKKFMRAHPEIDLISTEGGSFNRTSDSLDKEPLELVRALDYTENYRIRLSTGEPFNFCGLGLVFRRDSLPLLGLWNLSFRAADSEFSFRVTAGKANIAWYTGYSFVNVSNPQSVSLVYQGKILKEMERLNKFYLNQTPMPRWMHTLKALGVKLRGLQKKRETSRQEFVERWPALIEIAEKWLEIKNSRKPPEFLWKK